MKILAFVSFVNDFVFPEKKADKIRRIAYGQMTAGDFVIPKENNEHCRFVIDIFLIRSTFGIFNNSPFDPNLKEFLKLELQILS
jgi:hypothetical protein